MHSIRRKDVKNIFVHLNKRTRTTLSEHDFIIHNEKNSHDIK